MLKKLLLLFFLSVFFIASPVFAQESEMPDAVITISPVVTISPSPVPEYALPYPGLLPDNPLYPFKAFRDRAISFLIGDQLKKAEFDLLQADKRLQAAIFLLKIKKDANTEALAVSTISKGENYFEEAVARTNDAKKEGKAVGDFARQLIVAAEKHKSVLKFLQKQSSGDMKKNVGTLINRMQNIENRAKLLLPLDK